jgi:hypothetical protein
VPIAGAAGRAPLRRSSSSPPSRSGAAIALGLSGCGDDGDGSEAADLSVAVERGHCPAGQGCVLPTATRTRQRSDAGSFLLGACLAGPACDPVAHSGCPAGTSCFHAGARLARRLRDPLTSPPAPPSGARATA